MRFIYLDEAGTSGNSDEPCAVDGGLIAYPDTHIERVHARCAELAGELPHKIGDIPFHAKEIWHGTKAFSRDRFDRASRVELLKSLASIPRDMNIPVIAGACLKDEVEIRISEADPAAAWSRLHMPVILSFAMCVFAAEAWMRAAVPSSEIAFALHEDSDFARGLRNFLKLFQNEKIAKDIGAPPDLFPIVKIKDELLIGSKRTSRMLQVADVCVFIIKRWISGKRDGATQELFSLIRPQIVHPVGPWVELLDQK